MALGKAQITLIPFDPDSTTQVERLYQQRLACGWNSHMIKEWCGLQRAGKKALQWIVLSEGDPSLKSKLAAHIAAWPLECYSIADTATSLGGKPREPSPQTSFIPVGHISLDSENKDPDAADPARGIYFISTFYVSRALQSSGLGRAAMDEIERLAISEPLNAKTLTLMTVANEYEGKKERLEAFAAEGKEIPKISVQDWYARRGYVVYGYTENMWSDTDAKGNIWWATAVHMRKDIVD